jgi:hypothetical protein
MKDRLPELLLVLLVVGWALVAVSWTLVAIAWWTLARDGG